MSSISFGSRERVGIVGAGIVGLAHAWSAAQRGHRVQVFERTSLATGASIRNFGMIWPIGQPAGEWQAVALRSRAAWLELSQRAGVWVHDRGSLHLAHRADEWAVLEEFAQLNSATTNSIKLLSRDAVLACCPAANPTNLIGGLFSSTELGVNPRTASATIAAWLAEHYGVEFHWNTAVVAVEDGVVRTADNRHSRCDRVVVCGGADFAALFPELLRAAGMKRCKLQMLKTAPQPQGWQSGPHIASGLTLRHYANFAHCLSLVALKERIAHETPELDQFGIHVMASQNDRGEMILGDSHEYDAEISPFDSTVIDDLMLRELRKLIHLPDWTITQRWHGSYAKHPTQPFYSAEPQPRTHICTGLGGAGMTMSFGVAERLWEQWT
ncbi:MAG TPA: TIGR03364 family FAD-dependent oxidoreductase [Pirellulaceae bacterium]|nr:TIGR03364 family FAD-dependent oxidoreductase [Pirellulaceae bacterium]